MCGCCTDGADPGHGAPPGGRPPRRRPDGAGANGARTASFSHRRPVLPRSPAPTGYGYRLAAALGHTVVEPTGSLVPLVENGGWCAQMQGLPCGMCGCAFNPEGELLYEDFGELLFTHFGLSGPVILSASAHIAPR
ncbi:MAG: NAD(P)/FAD-dependent oxidoreductase [Oscillospiraceae bacterium]